MKVVEYTTVVDSKVYEHLEGGWQLWGSPMYVARTDEIIQAMVRYEDEQPIPRPAPPPRPTPNPPGRISSF